MVQEEKGKEENGKPSHGEKCTVILFVVSEREMSSWRCGGYFGGFRRQAAMGEGGLERERMSGQSERGRVINHERRM